MEVNVNKTVWNMVSIFLFISLISCNSPQSASRPESTIPFDPRSIVLNDKTVSEKDVGRFTSWYCYDYVNDDKVLLEVGFFSNKKLKKVGFILFDGGNSGETTRYQRTGLEHRWDWGPSGADYSFIIQPNGTGLYYDFTTSSDGKKSKADGVYKCYQR